MPSPPPLLERPEQPEIRLLNERRTSALDATKRGPSGPDLDEDVFSTSSTPVVLAEEHELTEGNIGPRQGYDSQLQRNAQEIGTKLSQAMDNEEPYYGVSLRRRTN